MCDILCHRSQLWYITISVTEEENYWKRQNNWLVCKNKSCFQISIFVNMSWMRSFYLFMIPGHVNMQSRMNDAQTKVWRCIMLLTFIQMGVAVPGISPEAWRTDRQTDGRTQHPVSHNNTLYWKDDHHTVSARFDQMNDDCKLSSSWNDDHTYCHISGGKKIAIGAFLFKKKKNSAGNYF